MVGGPAFKEQDLISAIVCGAEDTGKTLCLFIGKAPEKRAREDAAIGTTCFQAFLPVPVWGFLSVPRKKLRAQTESSKRGCGSVIPSPCPSVSVRMSGGPSKLRLFYQKSGCIKARDASHLYRKGRCDLRRKEMELRVTCWGAATLSRHASGCHKPKSYTDLACLWLDLAGSCGLS